MKDKLWGLVVCVITLTGCLSNQVKTELCVEYVASLDIEQIGWVPGNAQPSHLEISPEANLERLFDGVFDSNDYSFVWFQNSVGNTAACGVHVSTRCASVFFEYSGAGNLLSETVSTCE